MTATYYIFCFFFYSFVGWFLESCYCSVRPKKWINRGFLRGPMCPIYGTGALIYLLFVMPFRSITSNLYLNEAIIFAVGLVLSDLVEFITSLLMEKLFNARWWDYSDRKFNLQGRICLMHTIYWGTAACLFCFVVHPILDAVIFSKMKPGTIQIIVILCLIVFAADLADTVRNALGIRSFSTRLHKLSDDITALSKIAHAAAGNRIDETRGDLSLRLFDLRSRYDSMKNEAHSKMSRAKRRLIRAFPYLEKGASHQELVLGELLNDIKNRIAELKNDSDNDRTDSK